MSEPSAQRATTSEELLPRLRVIEIELFDYAYGKTDEGFSFAGQEEIATAVGAINRAIEEIERRLKA
jgi:hypothetical protein